MSGDWIKMRGNLWDDPRVSKLCDITGSAEACVIGALYWLWATADQHSEDGFMPGLSTAGIDRKTGVEGIGAALVEIDWISVVEGGIVLVRFDEHNSASAKRRCMDAQRKANVRNMSASDADKPQTDAGQIPPTLGAREREEKEKETSHLTVATARQAEPPDCPHLEVLALWAEVLPSMPQHLPHEWKNGRADHLRVRWRETAILKGWPDKAAGLTYFRKLFAHVGRSPFLTGRAPSKPGGRPFVIELEWLVNPTNWAKVHEGKYHETATA